NPARAAADSAQGRQKSWKVSDRGMGILMTDRNRIARSGRSRGRRPDRRPVVALLDRDMIPTGSRSRRGPHMSATPDSTLADPEQIIADLRRERDEAVAREAAIGEILEAINRSPGDLAPVFDAILDKAMRLCEAACGHLYT